MPQLRAKLSTSDIGDALRACTTNLRSVRLPVGGRPLITNLQGLPHVMSKGQPLSQLSGNRLCGIKIPAEKPIGLQNRQREPAKRHKSPDQVGERRCVGVP